MSAERGWIVEPPPNPPATSPSHRYKWYKMMGATDLLPRHLLDVQRRFAEKRIVEIEAEQEQRNAALCKFDLGPALKLAPRYAAGRPRR